MKKIVYLLVMTGILLGIAGGLCGCDDAVVLPPAKKNVEADFFNFVTVADTLPFKCTVNSFEMEGRNVTGAYLCDVKAEVSMEYGDELFAVIQYEAQMKYIRSVEGTELEYILCFSTNQKEGLDLPALFDQSEWVFDPDNNFGHSATRNEKVGLPSGMEWGEVPEKGEKGINDREIPLHISYSDEVDNDVTAKFHMFEKFSEDLGVDFEWDFKMTYSTDNGLYLDFLHVGETLEELDSWVLISRPTNTVKAEVVYMLST